MSNQYTNETQIVHALDCMRKFLYATLPAKPCPFDNVGPGHDIITDVVHICAYRWDTFWDTSPIIDERPYNFKWKDVEISWYKYLGRETVINREITSFEVQKMLLECLTSLGRSMVTQMTRENVEKMVGGDIPCRPGQQIFGYCNHATITCGHRDMSCGLYLCTSYKTCMWKEEFWHRSQVTKKGKNEQSNG